MSQEQQGEPVGTLQTALAHASRLLARDARLAEIQAGEILTAVPGHPEALMILADARVRRGGLAEAREALELLAQRQPRSHRAHLQLGLTLAALGEADGALTALRRTVALKPDLGEAWRALGDQLVLQGDTNEADQAYAQSIRCSTGDPQLMDAALALCDGRLDIAERRLREHLKLHPTDVAAIRMLAETGTRLGRYADAEALLSRCLELAPSFLGARHNYAVVLYRQGKGAEVLPQINRLLEAESDNPGFRSLRAAALTLIGEYGQSIRTYEGVLAAFPDQPKIWLSYGHALKTAGRRQDAMDAYRRAMAQAPTLGEAYWSLANMKTVGFASAEVDAMGQALERSDLGEDDRLHLHYALGKALEDRGAYAASFEHYSDGARIRKRQIGYRAEETTAQIERIKRFFTPERLRAQAGGGAPECDPIFVVGLPRSGSTLIEQILSSHSQVEGTMELPELANLAKTLGAHDSLDKTLFYPEILASIDGEALANLGRRYLDATAIQRKSAKPFFIDKMPNNFVHVGLIQMILPNARIIDARRHPVATCFSAFKQHFARGQHFSYDLADLGRYYRDYTGLMDHFELAAPGRVHRVIYERVVEDTETEVRRLLDYCGLRFEATCLRFHETERAVRTASSEQVRQPIFRQGLEQWRNYEPWLGSLQAALGDAADSYDKGTVARAPHDRQAAQTARSNDRRGELETVLS